MCAVALLAPIPIMLIAGSVFFQMNIIFRSLIKAA